MRSWFEIKKEGKKYTVKKVEVVFESENMNEALQYAIDHAEEVEG